MVLKIYEEKYEEQKVTGLKLWWDSYGSGEKKEVIMIFIAAIVFFTYIFTVWVIHWTGNCHCQY